MSKLIVKQYKYKNLDTAMNKLFAIDETVEDFIKQNPNLNINCERTLSIDLNDNFIITWKVTKP